MKLSNLLRIILVTLPSLLCLLLPNSSFPFDLTIIEQRVIAIFILAAFYWIFEPIPVFATSMLIIFLELVMISNKSFILFAAGDMSKDKFGIPLSYDSIIAALASPIVVLFLGGFFLAMAATKYRLDLTLAKVCLSPFGTNPRYVLLGLMLITGIASMFMSNTATTAMMLAMMMPVLSAFDKADPARKAFVLSIPVAANIGGIGTPIGTPPNAIALKYLSGDNAVSFGEWMFFAVPFVFIVLICSWQLLLFLFKPRCDHIEFKLQGKPLKTPKAITVYVVFALTIMLWLMDLLHGMNSYIVAMLPIVVFTATGIIDTKDLKDISWDVLWLVSGGIAIGDALESSGAASTLVHSVPFTELSPYVVIVAATLVAYGMATFISHTATANLVLPIVAGLSSVLPSLVDVGGSKMVILIVTFACSLAMALPISTPPNAMVHATGELEMRDMLKAGLAIGAVGLLCTYGLMYVLYMLGFFA